MEAIDILVKSESSLNTGLCPYCKSKLSIHVDSESTEMACSRCGYFFMMG